MMEQNAKDLGYKSLSELMEVYAIECTTRDRGKLMLLKARGQKVNFNMAQL